MTHRGRVALITGASAGLGSDFARLCAADGYDLVLVARREDKLRELARQLEEAHGGTVHVVAADLSRAEGPEHVWREVQRLGLAVDVLVNNAGFGSNGDFVDLDLARELEMIQLNVTALVALTHRFARPMRERGAGKILQIASTAGFQPGPGMATYFATKAFVVSFSEALAHELAGTGVRVTCHCPGATATEFAAVAGNDKSALFTRQRVAAAADVAAHAYRAMQRGEVLAIHGAMNKLGVQSLRLAPRAVVRHLAARLNRAP